MHPGRQPRHSPHHATQAPRELLNIRHTRCRGRLGPSLWRVGAAQSAQEKAEAIHDLAADEQVAVRVAADLLRRPAVAERAAADDTARHLFNRAQNDRLIGRRSGTSAARLVREPALERDPVRFKDGFLRNWRSLRCRPDTQAYRAGQRRLRRAVPLGGERSHGRSVGRDAGPTGRGRGLIGPLHRTRTGGSCGGDGVRGLTERARTRPSEGRPDGHRVQFQA
ncbi:DUF6192 family protein [Streptomyces sp. NPDC001889]